MIARERRNLATLLLAPASLLAGIGLGRSHGYLASEGLTWLLWVACQAALDTKITVACYRVLLLSPVGLRVSQALVWTRAETHFLICYVTGGLLIGLSGMLLSLSRSMAEPDGVDALESDYAWPPAAVVALVALAVLYVVARTQLVLPHVAIGGQIRFAEAWHRSRGNVARIAILVAVIPGLMGAGFSGMADGWIAAAHHPIVDFAYNLIWEYARVIPGALHAVAYRRLWSSVAEREAGLGRTKMSAVNRSLILVRPRAPFRDWVGQSGAGSGVPNADLDLLLSAPTAYLTAEITDEDDLGRRIENDYPRIFEQQLTSWDPDDRTWPIDRSLEKFRQWFDVELCPSVLDMADEELMRRE